MACDEVMGRVWRGHGTPVHIGVIGCNTVRFALSYVLGQGWKQRRIQWWQGQKGLSLFAQGRSPRALQKWRFSPQSCPSLPR